MRSQNRLWLPIFLAGLFPQPIPAQNVQKPSSPVLVELFTSQGCSSCPPAEALLNDWGMEQFQKGNILPLAFHVDYWDYLGWKDPFSKRAYSDRQRAYARVLGSDSIYTPEMVVNGRVGFVGSDAPRAERAVAAGRSPSFAAPSLKFSRTGRNLRISLELSKTQDRAQWFVALFENGLTTKIERGENAGSEAREDFVVRELEPMPSSRGRCEFVLTLDPTWKPTQCGIAAFAQDPSTMEIKAVRWLYPLAGR